MINFNYETDFVLANEKAFQQWLSSVIVSEGKKEGEINYIFCDDEYLLEINQQYLNDTLTDIISFDYSVGKELHGDIFISIERVRENAKDFEVSFEEELLRVLSHGILHYCGYKDKTESDEMVMRQKKKRK
jgi:rRNA maturation RNase YbeY